MDCKHFLLVCATLSCFYLLAVVGQSNTKQVRIPLTRFTCQGRASGYYADVDTGCQVYHMCDGLGRQFSYSCPNTTLFQQRMLICDHWYMVNCSMSERDYSANLLIGQRDKPFVSEEEMRLRTPRPDILSVPPNNNYYDGLKEAESKFPVHPSNSIVGIADSISSANNNGLDSAKQSYRPPTSWSTGTRVNNHNQRPSQQNNNQNNNQNNEDTYDNLTGAASLKPQPTFQPTPSDITLNTPPPNYTPPTRDLSPPKPPTTTEPPSSEEYEIDARMARPSADPVFNFINRFDPNSPDSVKTAMTTKEIIDLNKHLPAEQVSAERDDDVRTPRRHKNVSNNVNRVQNRNKGFVEGSRFNTVNTKPNPNEVTTAHSDTQFNEISAPEKVLVPPKTEYSEQPSSTMGPIVYYEWKWAAPAFDLELPKESNETNPSNNLQEKRNTPGQSPFVNVRRPIPTTPDTLAPTKNTEYNISSYFVPDYVFPLDKGHVGYDDDNAETSFQVKVARPGRSSYGENPECPQCHPAYLRPGTCEPCIIQR